MCQLMTSSSRGKNAVQWIWASSNFSSSIQAGHLAFVILESQRENPLFRSPIDEKKVQNILDLGTGDGAW